MATNACKFLCLLLLFAFVSQGFGQCFLEDLSLKQSKTGKMVKNEPEWEVRVTNPCPCTVVGLKLSCVGFQSITPIDAKLLSIAGNECSMVNNLYGESDFVFKYVWAKNFDLKIIFGGINCS